MTRTTKPRLIILFSVCIAMLSACPCASQSDPRDKIRIATTQISETIYLLECENGFGGGNVTASIGEEGILLADTMYDWMIPKIKNALGKLSEKPIRLVINSHFHTDHIGGNTVLRDSAVIISHQNVKNRLKAAAKKKKSLAGLFPHLTFKDSISIDFNGEKIKLIHFPNSHTDGDVVVYFTKSKVLHMGDIFFFRMFPAVYTQGGGDIHNLIATIESILEMVPSEVTVIPGHGAIASKDDLKEYLAMLKETVEIVQSGINNKKTLQQMQSAKVFQKYDPLGEGGAQTTDQYLGMIYQLLTTEEN